MPSPSAHTRVVEATELSFGRNTIPYIEAHAEGRAFGVDLVALPQSGVSRDKNVGVPINTVSVQVSLVQKLIVGAQSALALFTAADHDDGETYTLTVDGVDYDSTGETTALAAAQDIAAQINADIADADSPRAAVIETAFGEPAVHVWSFASGGMTVDYGVTGDLTMVVGVDPASATWTVYALPKQRAGAAWAIPWGVPLNGDLGARTANFTDRFDLAAYDRVTAHVSAWSLPAGNGADVGPLVIFVAAPAELEE